MRSFTLMIVLSAAFALLAACSDDGPKPEPREKPVPFHPAVELAALGVAAMAVLADPDPSRVWADCALGWTLLALAWIDWTDFLLPDVLTLPLIVARSRDLELARVDIRDICTVADAAATCERIAATVKELSEERDAVKQLGLI